MGDCFLASDELRLFGDFARAVFAPAMRRWPNWPLLFSFRHTHFASLMLSSILQAHLAFRPRRKKHAYDLFLAPDNCRALSTTMQAGSWPSSNAQTPSASPSVYGFKQILCEVPCHLLAHNRYATWRAAKLRPSHLLWYQYPGCPSEDFVVRPLHLTAPQQLFMVDQARLCTRSRYPNQA